MKVLEIISPGPLASIQDLGRPGRMKYGVPPGGALDRESLQLANVLVGNALGAPAVEITLGGFNAVALCPTTVAVTGAWAQVEVDDAPVAPYSAIELQAGQVIAIGTAVWGTRIYLAVAGGIDAPLALGSAATFMRGQMGGLNGDGKPLRTGDVIAAGSTAGSAPGAASPSASVPFDRQAALNWATTALMRRTAALNSGLATLRVVLGPQDHLFTRAGLDVFVSSEYTVTPLTDRMGARLDGPTVSHKKGPDIVSDGMPAGAVQIPGDGKPIIMLADRQTTGGYAKIACVAAVDLDISGQLHPGSRVRFEPVTAAEAHLLLAREKAARARRSLAMRVRSAGAEQAVTVVEV